MRVGPVAFLFATIGCWAIVRAIMLWPPGEAAAEAEVIVRAAPRAPAVTLPSSPANVAAVASSLKAPVSAATQIRSSVAAAMLADASEAIAAPPVARPVAPVGAAPPIQPATSPVGGQAVARKRFSVSAWTIVRGSSAQGLAAAGQLGGSQAGLRARYDLGRGLAVAARLSGPLRDRRGREAAVALDWRPVRALPVTFTLERRAGLDRGGRDAFAAGAFGGFDNAGVLPGLRADGYAQAGVVGGRRRDPYVDGAFRLERGLAGHDRVRIGAGAGLWGGAQPGAARLDIGPQLVAHVPLGPANARIGAEWRQRVAGHARPGSGPALSIGADF